MYEHSCLLKHLTIKEVFKILMCYIITVAVFEILQSVLALTNSE